MPIHRTDTIEAVARGLEAFDAGPRPGNRVDWSAGADNIADNRGKPPIAQHAGWARSAIQSRD